jgi:hypothetical protein
MHQIAIPLRFMATDDAGRSAHKHTGGSMTKKLPYMLITTVF